MKRILISIASIAMILAIAFPVFAEPVPNENFMKAAAARNAYLTSQVPAINQTLDSITANNMINIQDWNKIIPLIDKFQSDQKEAIKIYGDKLITAKLNPDLIQLSKLYYQPIWNGRDLKGEIKALLAKMTGQDIKEVSSNLSFGVYWLLCAACVMAIIGLISLIKGLVEINGPRCIASLICLVIGVGGILLIALV